MPATLKTFTLLFVTFLLGLIAWFIYHSRVKKSGYKVPPTFPERWRSFLQQEVNFYAALSASEKLHFEADIERFLGRVRITGIGTAVEDEDRLLVASSAVIPIFAFPDWEYQNLMEVLLYPDTFSEEFDFTGHNRNIAGMVGSGGVMNHVVIFSKPALHQGFDNKTDKHNVGIHEFVHLFDKQDGNLDGIPAVFMQNQAILPWLHLIQSSTEEILAGKSDLIPYASTNRQEFLAIAAEYFFERPKLLQKKHPELYEALSSFFQADLAKRMKD